MATPFRNRNVQLVEISRMVLMLYGISQELERTQVWNPLIRNIRLDSVGKNLTLLMIRSRDSVRLMTTANPFPGMNPFFELQWRDAHSSLIIYLSDALQEMLPADLVARTEEEMVAVGSSRSSITYRPDVQVREPWTLKEPDTSIATQQSSGTTGAAEPIRIFLEDEVDRWIEIRDATGRLITALELLSPTNKLESIERYHFLRKRRTFLRGGANLVEIDLVRQGTWTFAEGIRSVLQQALACYAICVYRAACRGEHEVYPIRLRERLPIIRIPLRPSDADVVLDLQPLIDQCHQRRRYHLLNYRCELDPPFSAEDAIWIRQLLTEHGLV